MQSAQMRKFRQLVFTRPELREALHAYVDDQEFVAGTLRLAGTFGIVLDAEEVRQALNAGQREWVERWI